MWPWLVVLLVAFFAAGAWLARHRWINPDEGAHLMDGVLLRDGLIPLVDYRARQVAYVGILALWESIVGLDYAALRILPLLANVATAALTYLLGARLFDPKVGLLGAALLTLTPFTLFMAPMVKTEPITLLFVLAGAYAAARAVGAPKPGLWFALAGAAIALAMNVRQSSIAVLLPIALWVVMTSWGNRRALWRGLAAVGLGFALVCVGFMVGYATVQPWRDVLTGPLNPVAFVVKNLAGAFAAPATEAAVGAEPYQSWALRFRNAREAAALTAPLFMGGLVGLFLWIRLRGERSPHLAALTFLLAWVATMGAAYLFWAYAEGVFFQAYILEFLPPLALITAFVVSRALQRLPEWSSRGLAIAALGLGTGFVVLPLATGWSIHRPLLFTAAMVGVTLAVAAPSRRMAAAAAGLIAVGLTLGAVVVARPGQLAVNLVVYAALALLVLLLLFRAARVPSRQVAMEAASIGLVLMAGLGALTASVRTLGLRYDGVWSPETVRAGAAYLREAAHPDDRVLSGAVIWELTADRRPFQRVSHPLSYLAGIPPAVRDTLWRELQAAPPGFVILDGYVEKTYLKFMPGLAEVIERDYELERTLTGSRVPVRIYRHAHARTAAQQ